MSKSTIVSLLPIALDEKKPGMYPGQFIIPAAKADDFEILPIEDSIYYIHFIVDDRPPLKVSDSSEKIAASVINDYSTTVMGLGVDAGPGLFWVPDHPDKKTITVKYAAQLLKAKAMQIKWFTNLVRIADDEWVKSGKMHRSISSLMRAAAKAINVEREWYIDTITEQGPTFCPACMTAVHPKTIVCGQCRAILKAEEYKKMAFATV